MPIPTPLTDALTALQADADNVTAKQAAKAATSTNLATAQGADANSGHDLTAAQAKQATDLAAFIALVQSTYSPTTTP